MKVFDAFMEGKEAYLCDSGQANIKINQAAFYVKSDDEDSVVEFGVRNVKQTLSDFIQQERIDGCVSIGVKSKDR